MVSPALSTLERAALVLCAVLSTAFFLSAFRYSPAYDEGNYVLTARFYTQHGLFAEHSLSSLRPYGYPLFLIPGTLLSGRDGKVLHILAFVAQFGIYLTAAFLIRRELARFPRIAAAVFIGLCLNVFVLTYLPSMLTDGFTAALIAFLFYLILVFARIGGLTPLLYGGVLAGYLVAVRPGNLFVIPFWLSAVAMLSAGPRARHVLHTVIAMCVPLALQMAINIKLYGVYTPLVVDSLGTTQHWLGIALAKYATGWIDAAGNPATYHYISLNGPQVARVFYENPFFLGTQVDPAAPLKWYFEHPLRGLATVVLHIFSLVDHDLIFAFSPDLVPAYRWPVAVLNHAMVGLAIYGVLIIPAAVRKEGEQLGLAFYLTGAVYVAGFLAIYALVAVETRFGLPLMLLAAPLAAVGALHVIDAGARFVIPALLAYMAGALTLSEWVRYQAPLIQAHRLSTGDACGGFFQFVRDLRFIGRKDPGVQADQFATEIDGELKRLGLKQGDVVLYRVQTHRPERYPCIDGKRTTPADLPPEEPPNEEKSGAVVQGPYFDVKVVPVR